MGKRGYSLGEVSLILIILILLVAVAAYSVFADCPHGALICGIRYDCSPISDDVCPDDFVAGTCCGDLNCIVPDIDCGGMLCCPGFCGNLPTGALLSASCSAATGTAIDADRPGDFISVSLSFDSGAIIKTVLANGAGNTFSYPYERDVLVLIGDGLAHTVTATAIGVDGSGVANGQDTVLLPNPMNINSGSGCGYFNYVKGSHISSEDDISWPDNINIFALVNPQSQCIDLSRAPRASSTCVSGFNVGLNDNYAVCTRPSGTQGAWFDPDYSEASCNACSLAWLRGGETIVFGEYTTGTSTECCGDDANEFITTAGVGPDRCCNASTDVVDIYGNCITYRDETRANGNCNDGIDNDGDGEDDWDDASWSVPVRAPYHGDDGCRVGVAGIPQVSNAAPYAGQTINVNCTVDALGTQVNSVYVYIDENSNGVYDNGIDSDCGWPAGSSWLLGDTVAGFIGCNVGSAGNKRVVCDVYNSSTETYDRSYQLGSAVSLPIAAQSTSCSPKLTQADCLGVPGCSWYVNCKPAPVRLSSYDTLGTGGSCINSSWPAPTYNCSKAVCGETCDSSDYSACADKCVGNIWNNESSCGFATCGCTTPTFTDCDNFDCLLASRTCQGVGTATIFERGVDYNCEAPIGCGAVGQRDCTGSFGGGPWACDPDHECLTQSCGGINYVCHYDAGAWSWILPSALPAAETSCNDNRNNDCDLNGFDCADSLDCSKDANFDCCINGGDALTPTDNGINFGVGFFDAPAGVWPEQGTGNQGTAQCCGNDANEWYFTDGFGACCDQGTDCVNNTGSCYNTNTPVTISHTYHCNNRAWDICDAATHTNGATSGTYRCGYNASDGGWRWRAFMPGENCTDAVDNDFDGDNNCADPDCEKDVYQTCCDTASDTLTPGDSGIRYGASFFDAAAPGNYNANPNCCGDDANEWYRDAPSIGDGACCDASTDCVSTFTGSLGACFNAGTRAVSDTALCNSSGVNPQWYYCNNTVYTNGQHIGSYYCSYVVSDGGWKWRNSMPPESIANNNCFDGVDNDFDGRDDWDTATWSNPSRGSAPGDDGCPVGINAISVSATTVVASTGIDITCTINAGGVNVDSIYAFIDNNNNLVFDAGDYHCGWNEPPDHWTAGNATVVFVGCNVQNQGTKQAVCVVNTSRSFAVVAQQTQNRTITVMSGICPDYLNQGSCNSVPGGICKWVPECEPARLHQMLSLLDDNSGNGGSCVPVATPVNYGCGLSCGDECSGVDISACNDYCGTGNLNDMFYYNSVCDTAVNCNCSDFWIRDCSLNYDCTGAKTCQRISNSVIREMGDNYSCSLASPTGCAPSNTVVCNGSWTCGVALNCSLRACGTGTSYQCHRENSIWNWTLTTNMGSVAENCSDGYDNNCNNLVDCADPACTDDANANCCLAATDQTPGDTPPGLGFGANLFDDASNNAANPQCCGDDASEWYFNFTTTAACCDQASDCVRFVPEGVCVDHDQPQGFSHLEHCNNTEWNMCDAAHNGDWSGTYRCGYNVSDSGWMWRPSMPGEICDDAFDNDGDGWNNCSDADCTNNCIYCPVPEMTASANCNDGFDNDCDTLTDGLDPDCPEGSGPDPPSIYRGCNSSDPAQLGDDDSDLWADEDDPDCADMCLGTRDGREMVFDNTTYQANYFGVPCGVPFTDWETSPLDEFCCGNDATEFYNNTQRNSNLSDDSPTKHACCDMPTDCVDANGNCQIGVETDCFNHQDDDCNGYGDLTDAQSCLGAVLSGYVYDEKQNPIGGVVVTASPPALGTEYERRSEPSRGYDGYYEIRTPPPIAGTYNFIARKPGYDGNITKIPITAGAEAHQNFVLRNGSCHDDCTDSYGNCNPACDGSTFGNGYMMGCNFVSELCAYRPKGFVVKVVGPAGEPSHDGSVDCTGPDCVVRSITCCEGEAAGPSVTYPVIFPRISGDVKDLRVLERTVKKDGNLVTIKFAVFWPKD